MVVIRLARHGAHNRPYYRVVVADQRKRRDGKIIEQVGTYDPKTDPSTVKIDLEKVDAWIAKGAQPSDTVAKLIAALKEEPLPAKIQARADLKAAQKAEAEKAEAEKAKAAAAEEEAE